MYCRSLIQLHLCLYTSRHTHLLYTRLTYIRLNFHIYMHQLLYNCLLLFCGTRFNRYLVSIVNQKLRDVMTFSWSDFDFVRFSNVNLHESSNINVYSYFYVQEWFQCNRLAIFFKIMDIPKIISSILFKTFTNFW